VLVVRRLKASCCKHDLLRVPDLPGKIDHAQAQQLALSEESHYRSQSGAPRKEDAPLHFVGLRYSLRKPVDEDAFAVLSLVNKRR
jgi:hypothetical protein